MYCRDRVVLDSSAWMRLVILLKKDSCTVGPEAAEEVVDDVLLLRGVVGEPEGWFLEMTEDLEEGGLRDVEAVVFPLEDVCTLGEDTVVVVVDEAPATDTESGEGVTMESDSVELAIAVVGEVSLDAVEEAGLAVSVVI